MEREIIEMLQAADWETISEMVEILRAFAKKYDTPHITGCAGASPQGEASERYGSLRPPRKLEAGDAPTISNIPK